MTPLEDSLSTRQARFYEEAGLSAFEGTVPFRLATSWAMAAVVAGAARAFARAQGCAAVRVVDLGAGTGRLGARVKVLLPEARVALVDGARSLVDAWAGHPDLAGLERWQASALHAGALAPALETSPTEALVVVGTYLLDTLPHALVETPSGLRAAMDAAGRLVPGALPAKGFAARYAARLPPGRAFVPVGAFDLVQALERATRRPTLLLLADKGPSARAEVLEGHRSRLVRHGQGASVAVNFDAFRAWLGWRGWWVAPGATVDFTVGATVLHRGRGRFDAVAQALATGPSPLAAQQQVTALRGADAEALVAGVLAMRPEGDVVLELADELCAAGPRVPAALREPLAAWLLDAVRTVFYLPPDDVAFHAGRVLHRLGFAGAAVACFGQSLARHGDTVAAHFNRAVCLAELGAAEAATEELRGVVAREPGHAGARRVLAELGAQGSASLG